MTITEYAERYDDAACCECGDTAHSCCDCPTFGGSGITPGFPECSGAPVAPVIQTADEARDYAIGWSHWMNDQSMSWGELAEWQDIFTNLAQRFPELTDEFQENGIC